MEYVELGLWDNWDTGAPEREEGALALLEAVKKHGKVRALFGYSGRTRELIAANNMIATIDKMDHDMELEYEYEYGTTLTITKK